MTFSTADTRKKLGLTQRALGLALHKGSPRSAERTVRRWEQSERDGFGTMPSLQDREAMRLLLVLWKAYHGGPRSKRALRLMLPDELKNRAPA